MRRLFVHVFPILTFALTTVLFAQSDPSIGTWALNVAQSKYTPGPAPRQETIIILRGANDTMRTTSKGVESDGSAIDYTYTFKYDGTDYPVMGSGMPNDGETVAVTRDGNTVTTTWKRDGKVVLTEKAMYSEVAKQRTITATGSNDRGQATTVVAVYDRSGSVQ
jgi:hypothetical protein